MKHDVPHWLVLLLENPMLVLVLERQLWVLE